MAERPFAQATEIPGHYARFPYSHPITRKGDTLPELQDILSENFIQEADGRWRTPDPNEAKDREALRTKVLLKEFGVM